MSNYLITILGPTASGKTSLAIELANYYKTEIISADSRQFYKEMSIGTAKPSKEELGAATHHFIDSHSVKDFYTAGKFETDALAAIAELHKTNNVVIMVGGSGLYINSVLYGLDPFPEIQPETRQKVVELYKNNGLQALRDEVRQFDPKYFLEVDLDNPRRLMRALEVCYQTKQPYSSFINIEKKKRPFENILIATTWQRSMLYERINDRVDAMITQGLIEEVKNLIAYKEEQALDTIGYKEIFQYLAEEISKEKAIELIKRNSRRYAKRQLTWFKNVPDINWFTPAALVSDITDYLNEKMK